ncbi:MAG: hypothetical protein JWP44_2149 [Mucilaginibacter sp.]|nr:hypothetical protein [Mucilaginibacter sp.]
MKKNIFNSLNLKPVFKFKNSNNNYKETDPTTGTILTSSHIIWSGNKSTAIY